MAPVLARRLFALMLAVYLFTAGGSLTTTDAVATFEVTRSMVEEGSVAMSGNLLGREEERGVDGRYYAPFGIGQSLYNIPFYLAGAAVTSAGLRVGKPDSVSKAAVALGATLLVAAIVWQFFYFALAVTGHAVAAALASVTLGLGSVLWPYSGFGFNQPLACFALLAAAYHALLGTRGRGQRHIVYAGFWMGLGFLTRHELMLVVLPLAGWICFEGRAPVRERWRRLWALTPGLAVGLLTWAGYNLARFGHPLNAGQDAGPGYGSPILDGLAGLLASPAASLFLYSPVAAAGVVGLALLARRGDRGAAALAGGIVVVLVVFYATLGNWIAGRAYGSRYLLIVLPFLALGWAAILAVLSPRARRGAFVCVTGLGLCLQLPGVLIDYAKVSQSLERPFTTEERQWRWAASPLVLNTHALVRALPENASYLLGERQPPAVRPASDEEDRSFSQQFSFSLDLWWLYLFYLGVFPGWMVWTLIAAASIGIGWLAFRLRSELRHTEMAPGPVRAMT